MVRIWTSRPYLRYLYAMHSEGVAFLMIKEADLGVHPRTIRVFDPIDAVLEDAVSVSKLKTPARIDKTPARIDVANGGRLGECVLVML
ncbi:hypothetical protein V8C44DRAFT_345344 [Trichoderma aethiopicum]